MRLLLDTHILIWWLQDDSARAVKLGVVISDPDNEVFVSIASIWEIAIKLSIGKLRLDFDLLEAIAKQQIDILPIAARHAWAIRNLPPIHGDPFDRLLVAQAQTEGLILCTDDDMVAKYPVQIMRP